MDDHTHDPDGMPPDPRGERPPCAEEEIGLGGAGSEGGLGPQEEGTEPQIPTDVTNPLESEEELRTEARRLAEDLSKLPEKNVPGIAEIKPSDLED